MNYLSIIYILKKIIFMVEDVIIETNEIVIDFKNFLELVKEGGQYQIDTPDGWQNIGDVYLKKSKNKFNITFSSGKSIVVSEDHLFEVYTDNFDESDDIFDRVELLDNSVWIRCLNMKKGDPLISKGTLDIVEDITYLDNGDTYDLEVLHNNHRYWSNDISSHNTGKSAIAEGLAQKIVNKKCSRILFDKRIVVLEMASLVSGTKYRGQFEERVKALMGELEKNPNIILFIDEIHTMIGAGGTSGSLDASNMFKPALARGEIQIIGATTLDEYRKHIEKDGALERRFQKVIIEPTTVEETYQILNQIKDKYEEHHHVYYTDDAIKACVDLTDRYITDRFLPDKAIDALDEVGSRVHISNIDVPKEILQIESKINEIRNEKTQVVKSQKYEEAAKLRDIEKKLKDELDHQRIKWEEECKKNKIKVSDDNVAEVVSMMSGIPLQKISQDENEKLSNMFENLSGRVIGQDNALKKVVKSIQRARIGLKEPSKPVFVGLCIGNSGVGKTQLAKEITKYLFDSEDALIRIDMSEYMEKISVNRIIGAPSGYVGYEDSNVLDKIRQKPYSVLLLDEVEKAHPDIFNIFLQAFDDGHITDTHGRKVSFKNTIILMTSNVGTRKLKEFGTGVGFNTKTKSDTNDDRQKEILEKELKKQFAPEFINRLDEIIYFKDLDKESIEKIIHLEVNKLVSRVEAMGYSIELDQSMIEKLIEVGYQPEYGARPMKRAIQRWVEDPITDKLISEKIEQYSKLKLTYEKDVDKVTIKTIKSRRKK
jgi:ATP-dependent Clp protease ATP-binding subunit ClpC